MFKNAKQRDLDFETDCRRGECDRLNAKYWELRRDIDAIAKHLGVKFEDINKRVLVKTDTPQSEP